MDILYDVSYSMCSEVQTKPSNRVIKDIVNGSAKLSVSEEKGDLKRFNTSKKATNIGQSVVSFL